MGELTICMIRQRNIVIRYFAAGVVEQSYKSIVLGLGTGQMDGRGVVPVLWVGVANRGIRPPYQHAL